MAANPLLMDRENEKRGKQVAKKIAWVTDSTALITEEMKQNPDLFVLPLSIHFGQKTFADGIDLTPDQLYAKINATRELPSTSQPAVGLFVALYERLKAEGYAGAVAVHLSSKLSGTLNASRLAAETAGFPVEMVDSKAMSYPITALVLEGMALADEGISLEAIAAHLRERADQIENYILLGSLEQFYKGGQMSGAQYLLGNILQVKPIIRINRAGEFEVFEKVRTERRAVNRIMGLFDQAMNQATVSSVQILHGNVAEKAEAWKRTLQDKYPQLSIITGMISSTIGVHAGEGTIALTWMRS